MFDWIGLASEVPTTGQFESCALEQLQRDIGFDTAMIAVPGLNNCPTSYGLDASLVERFLGNCSTYLADITPVKQTALAARGVAVDTQVLGERALQRTAYYRDLLKPSGAKHSLLAYVPLRNRVIAVLMLGRGGSGFSERNTTQVERQLRGLGVSRASYGLPVPCEPLPNRPAGLRSRLFGMKPGSLAKRRAGDLQLSIRDRNGYREMVASRAQDELIWTRAGIDNPQKSGWPYVELFHVAAAVAEHRQRALFIGSGGAVAVRQFAAMYPGIEMDLVEKEAVVVELADKWFGLGSIAGLKVHVAEGEQFVSEAKPATWDIVVVDAYDAALVDQSAFSSEQSLSSLHRAVRSGGAVAINIIGDLSGSGPVTQVVKRLSSFFSDVRALPVVNPQQACGPNDLRNVVVIAS